MGHKYFECVLSRSHLSFLFIINLLTACHENKQKTQFIPLNYELVFSDHFSESDIDTISWQTTSINPKPYDRLLPRNNCNYTNAAIMQDENVIVKNGFLNLIAKNENCSNNMALNLVVMDSTSEIFLIFELLKMKLVKFDEAILLLTYCRMMISNFVAEVKLIKI